MSPLSSVLHCDWLSDPNFARKTPASRLPNTMTVASQQQLKTAFSNVSKYMTAIAQEMNVIGDLLESGEVSTETAAAIKAPKKKVIKDPNEPKKPLTSYFLFSQSMRASLKEKMPDAKSNEIAVQLGQIWRSMTPDEKEEYVTEAHNRHEEYLEQMKVYNNNKKIQAESPKEELSSTASNGSEEEKFFMSTPKSEKSPKKRHHSSHEDSIRKKKKEGESDESPKKKKKKSKKTKTVDDSLASQ